MSERIDTERMVSLFRPVISGLVSPCSICGQKPVPFDYHVDFDFWGEEAPPEHRTGVICLPCMASLTDGRVHDHVEMIYFSGGGKTSGYVPVRALEQERADCEALRGENIALDDKLGDAQVKLGLAEERIRLLEQATVRVRDDIGDRTRGASYAECCDWWNILCDAVPQEGGPA